jgi:ubiquinone/menaquinone biosynthesis C-methylase UbiE
VSRLSDREFKAMNNPWRRLLQRWWEFPMLKRFGVAIMGRDVLEVGCGSGYGAELLATLKPRSYIGFDFMPEQVAIAHKRMPESEFIVQDAAVMKDIPSASKDAVVVFGVLHHIPEWKAATTEIARVLRPDGEVYLEEPDGGVIDWFDRKFKWGHPVTFRLKELESQLHEVGFQLIRKSYWFGFGFYRWKKSILP